jgi:hypothetical protein
MPGRIVAILKYNTNKSKQTKNIVAFLVRKRAIPPVRPPLVDGVSANFCG